MLRMFLFAALVAGAIATNAAERLIDFGQFAVNQSPTGFVSVVTGQGQPGDWKIIDAEVPFTLAPLTPSAQQTNKRHVLAQLSQDSTDEHFPLLVYTNEVFGDFTLTTKFKCVNGTKEQMAGIAFRIQDEKNYYVIRASALGNTLKFYKFVAGQRSAPIGPEMPVALGVWHELTVNCKGSEIRCSLDGKEMPMLTDHSFVFGNIGFWTKSDSVSYFVDTRINYTPRESAAQKAIADMMNKYPRLLGLKLYGMKNNKLQVVASTDAAELGATGSEVDQNVIKNDKTYVAKGHQMVTAIVPVRDRNGDIIAALHVVMKAFPGQTDNNALARALPINQEMSLRIQSAKDLVE